jgi:tight adherence protein C
MTPFFVTFMFFCLMGAAAVAVYMAGFGSHRAVDERFAEIAVKIRVAQGELETGEPSENFARMIFKWAARRIPAPDRETPQGEKLSMTLAQAGFIKSGAAQVFQVVRVFSAVGGAALGLVAGVFIGHGGQTVLFMAAGAVVGLFLPSYYIGRRARQRQTAIAKQLSDVLDLLVVCVEAGLGLYEAIKVVGTEADRQKQEIGVELSLVSSEISAGASLGQALRSLAERTAVEDVKPLAATLIQSEQLGAQIGPALKASSDALRTRRRLRAEEMAQKASIKILFPLVLFVLPAMIAVIIGPALIQVIKVLGGGA